MEAYSGDVYALREELIGEAEIGETIDTATLRARLNEIVDATSDELQAGEVERLIHIGEPAARRLMLGNREQRRRRKRRKTR